MAWYGVFPFVTLIVGGSRVGTRRPDEVRLMTEPNCLVG